MAYRFKIDETFEDGFRRIAASQIKQALGELQTAEQSAQGVHCSRKTLKRLRALLRLVEPAIGSSKRSALNAKLRDIGRALSGMRDEAAISQTLQNLRASIPTKSAPTGMPSEITAMKLIGQDEASRLPVLSADKARRARQDLQQIGEDLLNVRFKKKGLTHIETGLEKCYRVGRAALHQTYTDPTDETFHDLRKAVQWHWRHMNLLSRAWPAYMDARLSAARELSQLLGDDQDLAILIRSPRLEADPERDALLGLAKDQRARLQKTAQLHAEWLFQEKPKAFASRIVQYWRTARRLGPISEPVSEVSRKISEKKISKSPLTPIEEASAPKLLVKKPREAPSRKVG